MSWLIEYSQAAERTDQLIGKPNHALLLAAGLFGEAGSVLAELKKERRETDAYPAYRNRLVEEIGDCLWYLTRLSTVLDPSAVSDLNKRGQVQRRQNHDSLPDGVNLSVAVGELLSALRDRNENGGTTGLQPVWNALFSLAEGAGIDPREAVRRNLDKTQSRWPEKRVFFPLFDEDFPEEEQLPRELEIEFRKVKRGQTDAVVLRCNGLNFGDRVTDNIGQADFYRFHDVFHFAYVVFLGWSPVIRALLKCKRKSDPLVDENQDGARATIVEEAVSAIVFSRAKEMNYYDGVDHVDYDLLKAIQEFIQGFEVAGLPLWQWETAILEGYRAFRFLREHEGGHVTLDMNRRKLLYHDLR
jgi:NTP pyrophosphatase (non-canonical NTP hydrolase)